MIKRQFEDIEVNALLLQKALGLSHGNKSLIADLINRSLRDYVNKIKLESLGYKEIHFRLVRHNEVKRIFAKPVAKHEIKHDSHAHMNDPHFYGVIYPSTIMEVFVTPKSNILIQKSVEREIHFCNGTIIRENNIPRVLDFQIVNQAESHELPETIRTAVTGLLSMPERNGSLRELDEDFFEELEL